jgi:predicted ATPase
MTDGLSLEQLDRRIAIVRDNINQLIEQAAARSGAADEALASDRIAQQSEELERLTKERDALLAAEGRKV